MTRAAIAITVGVLAGVIAGAGIARGDTPDTGGASLIQPYEDPTVAISQANAAAAAGDWDAVSRFIAPLLDNLPRGRGDQAEVHRLAGLAAFFAHRDDVAERELLAYLDLEPEARLDPAVVPPEAITFFEDVRARHGAELRARHPRHSRHFALNLLPPFGQFQNGQRTKGWLIGGGLLALTALHVTTYFVLRDWCGGEHRLCEPGGNDRARTARTLRGINIAAGIGAIALYVYGVVDGIRHYRRRTTELHLEASGAGGSLVLTGRF